MYKRQDLIVVGEWMPITIFKNNKGSFKNITKDLNLDATTGWWFSINEGDFDNDGDLDIFHSTRDFQSSLHGAHVAINDGIGNFQSLSNSILPNRPDQGFNATDSLFKGVPINADNLGCLDLISTTDSWQDASTTRNYIFSILNTDCSY